MTWRMTLTTMVYEELGTKEDKNILNSDFHCGCVAKRY